MEFVADYDLDIAYWYHSNYPKWFVLSQIIGRVVVLKDQIHKQLGHTKDLKQFMIKLGKLWK